MIRLAVMQPYVFPYLGYFQLLQAADRFVLFDDVNFIKKGWINRNRILLNGAPWTFTIPIKDQSQNRTILDSMIADDASWKRKLLTNLGHAYRKAPHFDAIYGPVEALVMQAEGSIAELAGDSIRWAVEQMGLPTTVHRSSELALPADLDGEQRILALCAHHGAQRYINPANGAHLYQEAHFTDAGVELRFLRMQDVRYPQGPGSTFEPGLSILDVLMHCSKEEVRELLTRYTLSTAAEITA